MLVLKIIEFGVVAVAIMFVITQVLVPIVREEELFPILRGGSAREKRNAEFREMEQRVRALEGRIKKQADLIARLHAVETQVNVAGNEGGG